MESLDTPVFAMVFFIVSAYALGSVSFAVLMAKCFGLGNLREIGSGNLGTTNVLRTGNHWAAGLTLILDVSKGFLPVLAVKIMTDDPVLMQMTGMACFLGHLWPIWHRFKGGKGVATFFGLTLAVTPLAGTIVAGVWLGIAGLSRMASLAALIAVLAYPIVLALLGSHDYLWLSIPLTVLVWIRHRPNIQRILAGQESRIKF